MLEQIISFLAGLTVAAAGLVGIGVATGTPHDGDPEFHAATARVAWAHQQASERRAAEELEEVELTTVGTDRALEALEAAALLAAPQAQEALEHAATQVAAGGAGQPEDPGIGAGDAGEVAPVEVPAGPPDGTPSGSGARP